MARHFRIGFLAGVSITLAGGCDRSLSALRHLTGHNEPTLDPFSVFADRAEPDHPHLVGLHTGVCWESAPSQWKCRERPGGHIGLPKEIAATQIAGCLNTNICIQSLNGDWRCRCIARPNLFGADSNSAVKQPDTRYETSLPGFSETKLLSAEQWHVCGVRKDQVACAGSNVQGELGAQTQLAYVDGDQRLAWSPDPLYVPDSSSARDVIVDAEGGCAIVGDQREVVCWGREFDDPAATDLNLACADSIRNSQDRRMYCAPRAAIRVAGMTNIRHLASGNTGLIVASTMSGKVYYWFGRGARHPPVELTELANSTVVAVEHIFTICAAQANGVTCLRGNIDPNATIAETNVRSAVEHYPALSDAQELVVATDQPCIRKFDGSFWCQAGLKASPERL